MTAACLSSEDEDAWWRPRDEESGSVIDEAAAVERATSIIEQGKEVTLDLSYCLLAPVGLKKFCQKLGLNKTLTYVDLSCNMLEDEGAIAFFGAIAKLSLVSRVSFAGNMVGPAGGAAFAECLKVNASLEKVSLFHNEIGDKGAAAVAEALLVNTTLHSLNLRENRITDVGAQRLVDCVKKDQNPTLNVLWVRNPTPQAANQKPERTLLDPLPEALLPKLSLLSQEDGLHYNTISATVLNELTLALVAKNPANDPALNGSAGGKKDKEKSKGKPKLDPKEELRKKAFWTPPASPEPLEPAEDPKAAKAKKKR